MAETPNDDWAVFYQSDDWDKLRIEHCIWEGPVPRQSWWRRFWRWLHTIQQAFRVRD